MAANLPVMRGSARDKPSWTSPKFIFFQLVFCGASLCFGFLLGINYGLHDCSGLSDEKDNINADTPLTLARLKVECQRLNILAKGERFPPDVHAIVQGMALVDRTNFTQRFDMGVPVDPNGDTNSKVLMLYNSAASLPYETLKSKMNGDIPTLSVFNAVRNCDFFNVILLQPKQPRQCTAIMGQYPSFHIQKWMRLPISPNGNYGTLDSTLPLQLVNRGAQANGRKSYAVPTAKMTQKYWQVLQTYLKSLPDVLSELKPLAAKVARKNTVIVMLSNHGQSELLMNFVCSARVRNLDLSAVLLFATDQETKDIAEGLGLTVFFDQTNFGRAPSKAAAEYGDGNFAEMMMAKIFCVQMVSNLGYDVLFQDLDVVWYRDALQYFHNTRSPSHGFDIYFQDDGNRAIFYAPYSANTGFYYVRANDLTRYFFNSLLMSGDLVYETRSHQIALVAILSEFASRYGLKAKVLSMYTDEFPGGHAYHNRRGFMKDLVQGKVHPYIFHMSWTDNKSNKILYFRQLGEWYVKENCIGKTAENITRKSGFPLRGSLIAPCCASEAIFSCHYQDKPSREPCPNAPKIDKEKGVSFW